MALSSTRAEMATGSPPSDSQPHGPRAPSRGLDLLRDPRLAPAAALGLLIVTTLVVFSKHLFGHWTFPWDFLSTYITAPPFVADTIGSGRPLWWSPFVASGFPVAVYPQAGIFFPLWWVFGALGVPLYLTTLTAVQVAHVCFGAAGMLALARARRLGWPWATAAAVGYLFFGGFYGGAEHADYIRGFAYLPWLLWALTPPAADRSPAPGRRWTRLAAVPPLAWLISSGAYPGQLPAFAIVAFVYLAVALALSPPAVRRRYRAALLLAGLASAAVSAAVLMPYLLANQHHDFVRVAPPTAPTRAYWSFVPIDVLGLELNSFALHPDGSITSWALALPVLVGLACSTLVTVRRHLPLAAGGIVALVLATTPKIAPIGKAMVALGALFPSRFPAADYKPAVAIALIVLSAEAWAGVAARTARRWPAVILGGALAAGAVLAPRTYATPTRTLWLALAVIAGSVALVALRPRRALLTAALLALIAMDGVREARDYRTTGGVSAWQASPAAAAAPPDVADKHRGYDRYVASLSALLRRAPAARPARVPPWVPLSDSPRGSNPDAAGWVADGYRVMDYGGPVERTLWQVEHSPTLTRLLPQPWHAYVFPCRTSSCPPALPPPRSWRPSASVRTLSYGAGRIVYAVDLARPALMVENELAIPGWQSNSRRAQSINAGIPLHTWRLSPGAYTFTASYHAPGLALQEAAAGIAVLAWLASVGWLLRRRRHRMESPSGDL